MNIAIIGAGNVAWHLTRALSTRHRIVQVFSRSLDNAQALAEAVQCPAATDNIGSIVSDADAYIIMVKDDSRSGCTAGTHQRQCHMDAHLGQLWVQCP